MHFASVQTDSQANSLPMVDPMQSKKQFEIMPWLRLLRISNLPSAIANILMGYLLVHQSWTPTLPLVLVMAASASMYLAGMVLNDAFDFEVDLAERPSRPLPAGDISKKSAWQVGFGLLILGVLIALAAGWVGTSEVASGELSGLSNPFWRTGLFAILLAILIVLYDGPMKRTIAAPFLMGGCRTLNILMGASTFSPFVGSAASNFLAATEGNPLESEPLFFNNLFLGLPLIVWWVAIAIGTLISGATLLGRKEAVEKQPRGPMVVAALIVVAGLIGLAMTVYCPTKSTVTNLEILASQKKLFPLFVALMSFTIMRRVIEAVATLKPKAIQMGVISVLRSLIIIDAAICYLAMPDQIVYALIVLSLLIPSLVLGKYIAST